MQRQRLGDTLRPLAFSVMVALLSPRCQNPTSQESGTALSIVNPSPLSRLVALDNVTVQWNRPLDRPRLFYFDFTETREWQPLETTARTASSAHITIPEFRYDTIEIKLTDSAAGLETQERYLCRFFSLQVSPVRAAYAPGDTVTLKWHPSEIVSSAVAVLTADSGSAEQILGESSIDRPDTQFTWVVTTFDNRPLPIRNCRFKVANYDDHSMFDESDFVFSITQ